MRKFTLILASLFLALGTVKADFVQTWTTTTTWGDDVEVPNGVDAKNNNAKCLITKVTATSTTATVGFTYTSGSCALNVIGVDLVAEDGTVVAKHYEYKHAGGDKVKEVFTLDNIPAGSYSMRYFVYYNSNERLNDTNGNIEVVGLDLDNAVDLTYTLTDNVGNTFEGSYRAAAGTKPIFTGVTNHSIANEKWVENHYTATITFFFPVSSATTTNATMISSFGNSSYKWYADGTNISTKEDIEPALTNLSAYQWAIYPKCVNGAFSFTIKNIATGKYIYSTSNANSHATGAVTLAVEGSELTFENRRFKLSTGKYLSLNSTSGATGNLQYVGTWGGHDGCNLAFPTTVYTVDISDAKAATLTTPIAVSLPTGAGVTAGYVSRVNTETQVLEYTDVTTIPAGESVVIFGEAGTYTFSATNDAEEFVNENYLVGYTVATDIPEGQTVYALGNKTNGVAFYSFTGTQYTAYKAYLQLPEADAQAIGYFNVFGGEGTTGIENTEVATQNSIVIFDLMGRRVETMTEGNIYIVNGKKIIR